MLCQQDNRLPGRSCFLSRHPPSPLARRRAVDLDPKTRSQVSTMRTSIRHPSLPLRLPAQHRRRPHFNQLLFGPSPPTRLIGLHKSADMGDGLITRPTPQHRRISLSLLPFFGITMQRHLIDLVVFPQPMLKTQELARRPRI
jgi:hypothetical protein